jgi:hypothetical protein
MSPDYKYLANQMLKVCPLPVEDNGTIRIQLSSERGKTNYLNITPYQFREIEKILIVGGEDAVIDPNKWAFDHGLEST